MTVKDYLEAQACRRYNITWMMVTILRGTKEDFDNHPKDVYLSNNKNLTKEYIDTFSQADVIDVKTYYDRVCSILAEQECYNDEIYDITGVHYERCKIRVILRTIKPEKIESNPLGPVDHPKKDYDYENKPKVYGVTVYEYEMNKSHTYKITAGTTKEALEKLEEQAHYSKIKGDIRITLDRG